MNDEHRSPVTPRSSGRPKKHLHEDHHFRTSDDAVAADASAVAAESDQADTSTDALAPDSISAEPIEEAVVENPTLATMQDTIISVAHQDLSAQVVEESYAESPVEQKIHQLVDTASLNGWQPIESDSNITPPRNGMAVRLSETPAGDGVVAFWKRERAFANATKRWQEHGVWRDFHTGAKVDFEPKYWKERYV